MEDTNTTQKSAAALREEAVLKFWKENDIFKKSLEKNKTAKEFVFFEGPPTANAKPALHHLEARAFKDVIPRYKTMQGLYVPRRAGWDTHGLPVELQIEKALGLTNKKDIEKYGIAAFNKACKDSVFTYIKDWETFTDRIGYWVDKSSAYYTFNPSYMESLWNIIGKVHEKGLLYKDYRVLPWCARCGTTLATHELAQGYQDDKDLTVYVKFPIKGFDKAYFVAWTTTPWTLPGNVALAVGPDIDYVEAKVGEEILVVAKDRLSVLGDGVEVIAEHKGSEMVGMEYEPLYDVLQSDTSYKIYAADFVTTTDGTGIVHIAPMYGADDFEVATKNSLPKVHTVDEAGHFTVDIDFLKGRFVKDEEVAVDIIKDLANRPSGSLLFKKEKYEHSYPHCWRCKTPLIYYARDSWYIRMSDLKDKLIAENQTINWEPDHIKEGRFGEWLEGLKDWAISRERYWGTPLPIWQSEDGERIVVDSVATLKKYTKKSGNTYFVMRHGQTEHNVKNILNYKNRDLYDLTDQARIEIEHSVQILNSKNVSIIYTSPFRRTKETAYIVADKLGIPRENIIEDERLCELNVGELDEKSKEVFLKWEESIISYDEAVPGGESYNDAKRRFGQFLYEIDTLHKNETVLIVGHGITVESAQIVAEGGDEKVWRAKPDSFSAKNAEIRSIDFAPLPHNNDYELDLHRPYIDDVVLEKNGKEFRRVKEVMDVWFDSGSMPFAQDHYPFEHKDDLPYPADFISEAIDQTRGWFYTLLAAGVLMDRGTPYKNVICLGHLLDKDGKKMSKSVGNIVEPFEQIEKFGVDAVRYWMYSVNQAGESKNYDEKSVTEINNKVFNLLGNVYSFYELYRDKSLEGHDMETSNVLDQWIIVRLNQTIESVTSGLDSYDLFTPTRTLREFCDDLSTWYLRRSRDRLKDADTDAKRTLYIVLKTTAQLLAPFAPFMAEDLWQKLKTEADEESVHLSVWPQSTPYKSEKDMLDQHVFVSDMEGVRDLCAKGNALRKQNNIPIRQPLNTFYVNSEGLEKYYDIVKEELNVKNVVFGDFRLDTTITPDLKLEGDYRELVRMIQDLRKEKGLQPQDEINLTIPEKYKEINDKFGEELKKTVGAKEVVLNGEKIVIQ